MHMILGLFLSYAFAAAPIHFDSLILTKDTSQPGWNSHVNRSADEICAGVNHGIDFTGYQAAVDFDALQDGVYDCKGEFVAIPGVGKVEIFALTGCQPDPNSYKCP